MVCNYNHQLNYYNVRLIGKADLNDTSRKRKLISRGKIKFISFNVPFTFYELIPHRNYLLIKKGKKVPAILEGIMINHFL